MWSLTDIRIKAHSRIHQHTAFVVSCKRWRTKINCYFKQTICYFYIQKEDSLSRKTEESIAFGFGEYLKRENGKDFITRSLKSFVCSTESTSFFSFTTDTTRCDGNKKCIAYWDIFRPLDRRIFFSVWLPTIAVYHWDRAFSIPAIVGDRDSLRSPDCWKVFPYDLRRCKFRNRRLSGTSLMVGHIIAKFIWH